MSAQPPDDDPHGKFRDLCMLYGDFNRTVFLEEILHFIAGFGATKTELSAIRAALQKRTKQLTKRAQKGRPRASEDEAWIQRAMTTSYRRHILGWSWNRIAKSLDMKATKPNLRTLQRRDQKFAEFIAGAIPAGSSEAMIVDGRYGRKLRDGALDSLRMQMWLRIKTGLPFDSQPEDCKKLVEALLRLA
jgi:hypothetical protein